MVKSWSNEEKKTNLTVIDITDDFLVCRTDSSSKDNINLPFDKVVSRSTFDIGVNPTDPTSERLQTIQYSLDSIFFDLGLNMKESDPILLLNNRDNKIHNENK